MSKVILWPNKILSTPCKEVVAFDTELQGLVKLLESSLYGIDGYGLSANQVGHTQRMFAARIGNDLEFLDRPVKVFINPRIIVYDGPTIQTTEGCLSLPGIKANIKVRRPDITLVAYDKDGMPFQERLINTDAVVVQHELDHLNGVTLLNHMNMIHKQSAVKKLKRLEHRHGH